MDLPGYMGGTTMELEVLSHEGPAAREEGIYPGDPGEGAGTTPAQSQLGTASAELSQENAFCVSLSSSFSSQNGGCSESQIQC